MTKVWNSDVEQPILTRYNRNGIPYQINHERYIPANGERTRNGSRGYSISSHDNQQNEQDSEETSKQIQRRRIPVACGRCRKRKIRCSGPIGDTGCQNCKTAGNDNCQFNRVQSEEVPFLKDGYHYDSIAAQRTLLRGGAPAFYAPTYGTGPMMIQQPYRQIPLHEYQFPTKSACYTPSYIDYGDDGIEYNIMPHAYQQLSQDHINLPYATHPNTRSWTPGPGPKTTGHTMYYDPDSSTPFTPVPPLSYHSNPTYPLRSSTSTESNNFSIGGMANSLPVPSPLTSNERMLPMPARPLPRTADSLPYNNSLTQNAAATLKVMQNATTLPTVQSAYLPLSESPEGTSQSYSPSDDSSQQDLYSTNSNDWNAVQEHQTLRSHGSHSELYSYGPGSDNTSGRKLQLDDSGGGNGAGALSNGQLYIPYSSTLPSQISRSPSDDFDHERAAVMHRGSFSSVRAG